MERERGMERDVGSNGMGGDENKDSKSEIG